MVNINIIEYYFHIFVKFCDPTHALYESICIYVSSGQVFLWCACHCQKQENVCVYFTRLSLSFSCVVAEPQI